MCTHRRLWLVSWICSHQTYFKKVKTLSSYSAGLKPLCVNHFKSDADDSRSSLWLILAQTWSASMNHTVSFVVWIDLWCSFWWDFIFHINTGVTRWFHFSNQNVFLNERTWKRVNIWSILVHLFLKWAFRDKLDVERTHTHLEHWTTPPAFAAMCSFLQQVALLCLQQMASNIE